jgi:acylphosphatase
VFCGAPAAVEAMLAACRRGPPAAEVAAIDVQDAGPEALTCRRPGELFSVLPTT